MKSPKLIRTVLVLVALSGLIACTNTTRVVEVHHYSRPRTTTVVRSSSSSSSSRPSPSEFRVVNQYDNDQR